MFGKVIYQLTSNLASPQLAQRLEDWSKSNGLKDVSSSSDPTRRKYRFGSPFLSNPIYIEVSLNRTSIEVRGWVQTLIPFFTWKLIESPRESFSTKLDYRRKGGLFIYRLRAALTSPQADAQSRPPITDGR